MTYHERFAPSNEAPEIPLIDKFAECCDFQRWFVDEGWVSKQVAVDNMQNLAENWGLVICTAKTPFKPKWRRRSGWSTKKSRWRRSRTGAADLSHAAIDNRRVLVGRPQRGHRISRPVAQTTSA